MALPIRYGIEKKMNSMEGLSAYENGGKGSGNFGHSGRPGEIGGSGKGGSFKSDNRELREDEKKRVREKIIEIEPNYDFDEYDELVSYAFDFVDSVDTVKELKEKLRREYGGFLLDKDIDDLFSNSVTLNGGKGSGNFGHTGRPGEVGGSGKGVSTGKSSSDDIKQKLARLEELREKDGKEGLNSDEVNELYDLSHDEDVKYAETHPEKKKSEKGDLYNIQDLLERDDSYDLHGMSPETIVELMGEHTIHKDNLEDLQHYIDRAAGEMDALTDAAVEEFRELSGKVGEELREKKGVRKEDEWFVTTQDIEKEYKERGEQMEKAAEKVSEAIYETGDSYTGSKKQILDFIKYGIKVNKDSYDSTEDFLEQTQDMLDDLKYVEKMKSKKVKVQEHPMSGSGVIYEEVKDK